MKIFLQNTLAAHESRSEVELNFGLKVVSYWRSKNIYKKLE